MDDLFGALFGAIVEPILAVVGQFLLEILLRLIAVPVCWIVFTPVVLILAAFGPGSYSNEVLWKYQGIAHAILTHS